MNKITYTYPGSDLDRARNMIAALGSFWSRTYTGIDQLVSYANATAQLLAQSHLNLLETVASLSRYDVPVFHEENWYALTIKKSELNSVRTNLTQFNNNNNTFNDGELVFDSAAELDFYAFPLPTNIAGAAKVVNRIINPTVALDFNVDFVLDAPRNAILFAENPFTNPAFLRRVITGPDGKEDEELVLWLFKTHVDYDYIFSQFAYAVGMRLKSSSGAKQLMNAVITGLINGGASVESLDLALSAITGVPISAEPEETVETIVRDGHGLVIITDKSVYRFTEDVTVVVAVGQKITAGTRLIDAFNVLEFHQGVVADELEALALDRGVLAGCFYSDLLFENKDVPLEVDTDHLSGYTYVRFGLGGFPTDVDKFFDELHARGIEAAEEPDAACFLKPNIFTTRGELPSVGTLNIVYQTADTNKFYQWRIVQPAREATGAYIALTPEEREACGFDWLQFFSRASFPQVGYEDKLYVAADTGVFYKWVTEVPGSPAVGIYAEVLPPAKRTGTLARLLDTRRQPDGEPTAANLPATINPLKFLVENVLRNNAFCVTITVAALGQNHLGLYNIRHLKRLIPPQTLMFLVYKLRPAVDRIKEINLNETLRKFTAAEPLADAIPDDYVSELGLSVKIISGTCQ